VNASGTAVARIAGIALVLVLAATFGLIVGNLLIMRDAGAATGAGASTPYVKAFDGARFHLQQGDVEGLGSPAYDGARFHLQQGDVDGTGVPTYADPYRQIIEEASGADRSTESLTAPTPR
jgi:hypothetical protein